MDLAIAIRTGVVKNGLLAVQAAAGIVADSIPEMEWQETENKARAVLARGRTGAGRARRGLASAVVHGSLSFATAQRASRDTAPPSRRRRPEPGFAPASIADSRRDPRTTHPSRRQPRA